MGEKAQWAMALIHPGDSDSSSTSPAVTTPAPTSGSRRIERRKLGRHAQRLSVKLVTAPAGSASYVGLTENLSEAGAFVATRAPWDIGCAIDLIIGLPQMGIIRARGTVCWRRSASIDGDQAPGIGVRFERLSRDVANRIRTVANA
jgi:Tfp pilus assembly protein PilZ